MVPRPVLRRAISSPLILWLVVRVLFTYATLWISGPDQLSAVSTQASAGLVLTVVALVRIDMWRAREAILLRNFGVSPSTILLLSACVAALAEFALRLLVRAFS